MTPHDLLEGSEYLRVALLDELVAAARLAHLSVLGQSRRVNQFQLASADDARGGGEAVDEQLFSAVPQTVRLEAEE